MVHGPDWPCSALGLAGDQAENQGTTWDPRGTGSRPRSCLPGDPRLEVLASGDSGFGKTDGTATDIPTAAGQGQERASRAARVGGLQLAAGVGGKDVGGSTRLLTPGRGECRAPAPRWVAARGVV